MELSEWYKVSFDDTHIYRDVSPPGGDAWKDELEWKDIIRVCFKAGDVFTPDEIYIFVGYREESFLIPIEAEGGSELWDEIIKRGVFDAGLAIKAATDTEGLLYCWPDDI